MNFDFDSAAREVRHIALFMDMAQEHLEHIQPLPAEKMKNLESLYSLVLVSERIAQELEKQLNDGERYVMSPAP